MKILLLIFLSFSVCFAQKPDTTIAPIIEDDEDILEQTVQDAEDTQVYEIIEYLKENPLNLNTVNSEELMKIPGITLGIANEIIEYRNTFGEFLSVTELLSIKGIDKELYGRIKQYLIVIDTKQAEFNSDTNTWERVERQSIFQKINLNYRTRTIRDLQTRKGFATGKFYNSPFKLYQRLKLNYDRTYFINLISEKDAGEKNLTDFISGNFSVKDFSFIKSFVVGDYVLEFGQGLSLWRSIGFSKSSDAIFSVKKTGNGVIPYSSTDENQFFRGLAGTIKFSSFSISAFYSTNSFDASIDSLTQLITSRTLDGFHRTDSEINKKNSAKEILLGGRVQVDISKNLSLAVMHYNSKFDNSFQQKSAFSISGDKFGYSSFDFNYRIERMNLFGEVVRSSDNVFASIVGLQTYLTSSIDFVTLFRNYPAKFISLHGFGFGERSGSTQNEVGIYTGIKLRTPIGILNAYFDQFHFPFLLTNNATLTKGKDFLVEYNSKSISNTYIIVKYKNESKETNEYGTDEFNRSKKITVDRLQQNLRIELQKRIGTNTRLRLRAEIVDVYYSQFKPRENGYLILGDFKIEPIRKLKITSRFIFYQTDSYDSRVYEFENDLTGVLYNPGLYGRGLRWYVVTQYRVFNFLDISFKYSETIRDDVKKIGSGDSEINGNLDNRLSVQLELQL